MISRELEFEFCEEAIKVFDSFSIPKHQQETILTLFLDYFKKILANKDNLSVEIADLKQVERALVPLNLGEDVPHDLCKSIMDMDDVMKKIFAPLEDKSDEIDAMIDKELGASLGRLADTARELTNSLVQLQNHGIFEQNAAGTAMPSATKNVDADQASSPAPK